MSKLKVGDKVKYQNGFYVGVGEIVYIKELPTFNNAPYLLITDKRIEKRVYVPKEVEKEYGKNRRYSWFTRQSLEK